MKSNILIFSYESAWKTWMYAIDCFLISSPVPEISTFKVLKHNTQTSFNKSNSQNYDVVQYLQGNLFQNFQTKIKSRMVHSQHPGSATALSKFYKDLIAEKRKLILWSLMQPTYTRPHYTPFETTVET